MGMVIIPPHIIMDIQVTARFDVNACIVIQRANERYELDRTRATLMAAKF